MESELIKVDFEVEGMTCANCALGISRFLETKGLKDIYVNFATNEVHFAMPAQHIPMQEVVAGIQRLGYKVVNSDVRQKNNWGTLEWKFVWSAIFTLPLLLSMWLPFDILRDAWVQLGICLPVYVVGAYHFGKSGLGSLRSGVPNMDVLIFIGTTAAFTYSLIGTIQQLGHAYLFYETAATIITLVFLGNLVEKRSVRKTTTAIAELQKLQPEKARRFFFDLLSGQQILQDVSINDLQVNDHVQVNDGDRIPLDAEVLSGHLEVDESMITGESLPVLKQAGDMVTGGTIVRSGQSKLRIASTTQEGLLNNIIELVKGAQMKKPSVQKLADRIAAWFVPVVLGISLLTFSVSYVAFHIPLSDSIMRSIAVLVIACPCAMGLATPTAVMVGLGRSVKKGILIKGGATMEEFAETSYLIVDKTGTLTDGNFSVHEINCEGVEETELAAVISGLEEHSSHPIAKALVDYFISKRERTAYFEHVTEKKGIGIQGKWNGTVWAVGNKLVLQNPSDKIYDVYVARDGVFVAGINLGDNLKPGAADAIAYFARQGIQAILLSGDRADKCQIVAEQVGITRWESEHSPESKLQFVQTMAAEQKITMVGDGINDSPSLAAANTGVSMSDASQAAIHSAQIVLLHGDLQKLVLAHQISRMTLVTIKQNLFWAFFYNTLAIPVAALGFLSPMIAALSMAFSDVIVIGNSLRLRTRKIK